MNLAGLCHGFGDGNIDMRPANAVEPWGIFLVDVRNHAMTMPDFR
jgi:hypothetical protein